MRGRFGLSELEPAFLAYERILSLSERVEVLPGPDTAFPAYYSGGDAVTARDGRELRGHMRVNRGASNHALGNDEIVAKYMDTATTAVSAARGTAA